MCIFAGLLFDRSNIRRFILKQELSKSKWKKTSKQLTDLEEKKSTLIQQFQIWRPVQVAYTPHVATLLPLVHSFDNAGGQYSNPESVTLYFPLSLPPEIRWLPELKEVPDAELSLRS